jgi:hypothetical protein
MSDRDNAIALVTAQCQATVYPTLDTTEVGNLVDASLGFTVWVLSTVYSYDDVVRPTKRNGHLFRVIVGGISSATAEPAWPLFTAPDLRPGLTRAHWYGFTGPVPGSEVTDGTVVWIEAGPDDSTAFDAREATRQAWLMKAAKASADYDTRIDKDDYSRGQVIATCERMAVHYAPVGFV